MTEKDLQGFVPLIHVDEYFVYDAGIQNDNAIFTLQEDPSKIYCMPLGEFKVAYKKSLSKKDSNSIGAIIYALILMEWGVIEKISLTKGEKISSVSIKKISSITPTDVMYASN